ncbi:MAG: hypothetical protein DHS20C16_07950 [Phycisphaerae bacterium]|nr:MAG: hypothetical protein DHS20C16_07950 [Phycisphaerae bacterium]
MRFQFLFSNILVGAAVLGLSADLASGQYDPPAGFYNGANGTGSTLKSQLSAIMSSGHIQRTYGNFRDSAAITDADPNISGRILLVYNRASVSATWDSGSTWNREHVWPQSLQPGSASNSSKGNLGDPHALRPANPGINSDRGNKPFGNFSTTGTYGSQGANYFPGDTDKGDIARNLFYSATRYQSSLTLVNGTPGSNQMGDLASILRWHYTDPPDEFERRRNHAIYSSSLNPSFFTNNRNAYIDMPHFAWSVFGGGDNNSTLFVGGSAAGDGQSNVVADFGAIIVGGTMPSTQAVLLEKTGADPTYYSVTPSAGATSSVTGSFNAFDHNSQSKSIIVGVNVSSATAAFHAETVTIDNLDVDGATTGQGSLDGDDVIDLELFVLDHSEASFDDIADQDTLIIDFGTVLAGSGVLNMGFDIHNLEATVGLTADLDIDAANPSGDSGVLSSDVVPTSGIAAGADVAFVAQFDTSVAAANYLTTYTINVSDENLSGDIAGSTLTLTLMGEVISSSALFPFDDDGDGDVDMIDFGVFANCQTAPEVGAALSIPCDNQDADQDGDVDADDFAAFQQAFTG